jgi:hypothetical protein
MVRAFAVCCLLVLAVPQTAGAEWQFIPFVGLTFKGQTSLFDLENATGKPHRHFGGSVGLFGGGVFGAEALFVYTPGFFQTDDVAFETPVENPDLAAVTGSRTLALMGNVIVTTPRRWTEYSLRPYVSGGLGLLHVRSQDLLLQIDTNLTGFNIGGGAVGFLTRRTGLRFDVRYFSSLHRQEAVAEAFGRTHLSYMTASIGIVFRR